MDAIINCNKDSGKLFEPRNAISNDQIYEKAKEVFNNTDRIWIGINDIDIEGR